MAGNKLHLLNCLADEFGGSARQAEAFSLPVSTVHFTHQPNEKGKGGRRKINIHNKSPSARNRVLKVNF